LRLSLLESAVNRFIADSLRRLDLALLQRESLTGEPLDSDLPLPQHDSRLTREPLETMVHAKTALRVRLDLPESTVSTMTFLASSVLTDADLDTLAQEVRESSADPATRNAFLLGHATWRAGMEAAHPEAFAALARERDDDPFHDLDVPSTVEGQIEYAGLAREVEAKFARREDELLSALLAASEQRSGPRAPGPHMP
jgi:hypothetical protein